MAKSISKESGSIVSVSLGEFGDVLPTRYDLMFWHVPDLSGAVASSLAVRVPKVCGGCGAFLPLQVAILSIHLKRFG